MADITMTIDQNTRLHITAQAPPSLHWHWGPTLLKEHAMAQEQTMTREQRIRCTITPLTPAGNPAPLDGPAQFTITGLCTLEAIDDTSCWVVSPATGVGDSVVTVVADADMGEGVVNLMDTATVHVIDPMAASLGMGFGEPELKPPA